MERILELAVATRMTCSNPAVSGEGQAPVIVSLAAQAVATPDEFSCGAVAGAAELAKELERHIARTGRTPAAVRIEGVGTLAVRQTGGPGRRGRLTGCVAIVTGSAQGFGRGIAEALAREGAFVTVADLNDNLGQAVAEALNKARPGCAIFQKMDVTKSASIEACVAETVKAFGGVDMLVANAGVLKAGGLDELDEAAFDLVTSVNYKAYFLCAKAVAPVMKLQNKVNPRHFMDIIQINSKSGLQGSNRNFAYAGGKFGAIGLTQSFAMELVPWNIKVNAICPGNYFDGPLWSDPEKGLFVQYLRAGKVAGAKTIDDVRRAYLSKVPMNRGCTPDDVATTIFYIHDQTYETGQAIPVTGGQVMLA